MQIFGNDGSKPKLYSRKIYEQLQYEGYFLSFSLKCFVFPPLPKNIKLKMFYTGVKLGVTH